MLGLILNETEIVNKTIEGSLKLPSNSAKIIRIIIKKLILENKTDLEIENKVFECLNNTYKNNYNKNYWSKTIKSIIKDLKKKNIKMIDINNINIYKEELEIIKSLNDIKTEKVAFTLLIYAKINEIVNPVSSGKINIPLTNILKESLFNLRKENKLLLSKLYNLQYIKQNNTCNVTQLQINYLKKEGEIELIIDDLRDYQPITWYLEYRQGIKYKKCEKCGKRFEVKGKNNLFCINCSKKNRLEKMKKYNKDNYDKNKNS